MASSQFNLYTIPKGQPSLCSSQTVLPMGRAVEVMLICSHVIIDPRREGSKRFAAPRNSFKAQLKLFICTLYFFSHGLSLPHTVVLEYLQGIVLGLILDTQIHRCSSPIYTP